MAFWRSVAEDIEDGHELFVLPLMVLAPILFLVSPALTLLLYFLVPGALFIKRERIVELGPLRDLEPDRLPSTQPAVTTKVSRATREARKAAQPTLFDIDEGKERETPRAFRTREPRQAWVCLECWIVFAKLSSTIPNCPRCQTSGSTMKLEASDVHAARAMALAGAPHTWRKLKFWGTVYPDRWDPWLLNG